MKCSNCNLEVIGPSYQCLKGHIHCRLCIAKLLSQCSLCSGRNSLVEFAENSSGPLDVPPAKEPEVPQQQANPTTIAQQLQLEDIETDGIEVRYDASVDLKLNMNMEHDEFRMATNNNENEIPKVLKPIFTNLYRARYDQIRGPCSILLEKSARNDQLTSNLMLTEGEIMIRARWMDNWLTSTDMLTIYRRRFNSHVTMYSQTISVSDLIIHLSDDHHKLQYDHISKLECKHFRLNPRAVRRGINVCKVIYVLCSNARNVQKLIPVLVMSTRINLSDIIGLPAAQLGANNMKFLMVWVAGLLTDFPISAGLAVWSHDNLNSYNGIIGKIHYIQPGTSNKLIFHESSNLLMSYRELNLFTNDGQRELEMQLVIK